MWTWAIRARITNKYNTLGLFDCRYRSWDSFFVGYRYLEVDYDNGTSSKQTYFFDGDQQDPVLGVNFYI